MTTLNAPYAFADWQGDLGMAYMFAGAKVEVEIADALNAMDAGVVPLIADFAGTGTDIARVARIGNVGWARRFSPLATETSPITASSITSNYTQVSIGTYGLAEEETYKSQILAGGVAKGITLDELVKYLPLSFLATWRYLLCVTGSGFTTAVGSAAAPWTMDDELDLIAAYETTLGWAGSVARFFDPAQWTQLKDASRNETAFKFSADFRAMQALKGNQYRGDPLQLGIETWVTDDIQQAGGAYQGFSMGPGAVGWARANTLGARVANPQGAVYMPEFGLLVEQVGDGRVTTGRYDARIWLGFAEGSSTLVPRRRCISLV